MTTQSVNLSAFIPVDSVQYEIKDRLTGNGIGWFIEIADASHPKAQAYMMEQERKRLKRQEKIETAQLNGRKVKAEEKEVEEVRKDNTGWVTSRVVGWSPSLDVPELGFEGLEYTEENAIKVFSHPKMLFAFSQVLDVIGEDKSFTKASAKG